MSTESAASAQPESELLVSSHFPRRADPRIAHAVHTLAQKYLDCADKGSDEEFVIINDPEDTLKHGLLGVDMDDVMRNIFDVAKKKPSSRQKPLLAVMTGKGRGKTRLLVEIDRYLRTHHAEDTLSIPITFNHKWTSIAKPRDDMKVNYMFAVTSRILSMFHRIPLDVVHTDLKNKLKGVSTDDLTSFPLELVRETLRAIVGQYREQTGRVVRRLVLSVDEALKAEQVLGAGVHEDLRRAVLDERVLPDLDVALVMTSLGTGPLGPTSSGRAVRNLTAPMVSLRPKEVLDEWIPIYIPHLVLDKSQSLTMLSLIASLSSLPRAIQFLVQSIQETMEERGPSFVLDSETFQIVHNKTTKMLREEFSLASISVSTRCLHALLFGESLPVDDPEVRGLLTSSLFTNTVINFGENTTIKPQTCSMMLFEALKCGNSKSVTAKILCIMLQDLLSSLYDPSVPEGNALEVILNGLFEARLNVLGELAEEDRKARTIRLHELFLLDPPVNTIKKCSERAKNLLKTEFEISGPPEEAFLLSRSNDLTDGRPLSEASADFFEDAQEIHVSKESPCVKLFLDDDECADDGWLLKTSTDALCLIIDAKSAKVNESVILGHEKDPIKMKRFTFSRLPSRGHQAIHFGALCKLADPGADSSSLIGAMHRGNYLYVYLNTKNSPSFFVGDNVLHLGGRESAKFLSFTYDYYVLHRVVPE